MPDVTSAPFTLRAGSSEAIWPLLTCKHYFPGKRFAVWHQYKYGNNHPWLECEKNPAIYFLQLHWHITGILNWLHTFSNFSASFTTSEQEHLEEKALEKWIRCISYQVLPRMHFEQKAWKEIKYQRIYFITSVPPDAVLNSCRFDGFLYLIIWSS